MNLTSTRPSVQAPTVPANAVTDVHDRTIGSIIGEACKLGEEQIAQVLVYQREHGLKFGEAAVALGMARSEDVLWALSQQFHYPYSPDSHQEINPELVVATKPFSKQAESFRAIRSQLMMRLFNDETQPRRALSIISPDSGDGKTFFVANLAVAFSQLGGRTLVIDADMRNPRQHQMFGVSNAAGLSGILSGRTESSVICSVSHLPSLFVLPVGTVPPNPLELVERPAFGLLVRELMLKFDYVLVDTPAAVYGADASVIAAKCGAALAVARQGHSRVKALNGLVAALSGTPTRLVGALINEH